MNKKINHKKLMLLFAIFILFFLTFLSFTKMSKILEYPKNDVEVELNSELTYYLNVSYEGVDRNGLNSSENNSGLSTKVYSGYIYVEDKLPEGLEFKKFLVTENGTVGAVNSNNGKACLGEVINDTRDEDKSESNYYGLHYDHSTHKVSFRVAGLQAGCVLTVGIVTQTPETVDDPETTIVEERRDFYNFATAREEFLTKQSNTVHAFIKTRDVNLYNVVYEYTGVVPDNAPSLPSTFQYAANDKVGIANEPYVEGYSFSGWKIESSGTSVISTNTSFIMPAKNVKLVGSFTKLEKHQVTYLIEGDFPDGYDVPLTKEYYPNQDVYVDSLKKDDTFNGYRFLGWTTNDVELDVNGNFVMPDNDVVLTGCFEIIKYKVTYRFKGENVPENSEDYLPEMRWYLEGEKVTLPKVEDIPGYRFRGWEEGDNFSMPAEDIVIEGEWDIQKGLFSPTISKTVINSKLVYSVGDIVEYKITVANIANYPIYNVSVIENNEKSTFIKGNGYSLRTNHLVIIDYLDANSKVDIIAKYEVTEKDVGSVTNEVEIIGAEADEGYYLDTSKNYKSSTTFKLYSKLKICKNIDSKTTNSYSFHIVGNNYDSWVNVNANECREIYLSSGEYEISELVPQTDEIESINLSSSLSGNVNENTAVFSIGESLDNEIVFTNKYKKKGFYKSNGKVDNLVETCDYYYSVTGELACLDSEPSKYVTSIDGIDFNQISSDTNGKGLYVRAGTENDEYPIYYYRGEVINNNVIFANVCWKMVRTTETGGLKLIYNGTKTARNTCNNTTWETMQVGTSAFNSNNHSSKYVGYTYDDTNTNSTIKTYIDDWYRENILNKYDDYLEDTVWYNDRSISGTFENFIYYGVRGRLYFTTNRIPSLEYPNQSDMYTLKPTSLNYNKNLKGNELLDYPIALLTADEVALAGAVSSISNLKYYLYTGKWYWLMSAFYWSGSASNAVESLVGINGELGSTGVHSYNVGVRPSISLKIGTSFINGDGTTNNPYIVG